MTPKRAPQAKKTAAQDEAKEETVERTTARSTVRSAPGDQDLSIPPSYIVGPNGPLTALVRARLRHAAEADDVVIGQPVREAGGPNRRAMVVHRLTPELRTALDALLLQRGPDYSEVVVLDAPPADWRYPAEALAAENEGRGPVPRGGATRA